MENTELIIPASVRSVKKTQESFFQDRTFLFLWSDHNFGSADFCHYIDSVDRTPAYGESEYFPDHLIAFDVSYCNAAFGHHRTHDPRHGHPQEENDGRAMDYRLFYVLCAYVCYECNRHIYDSYLRNTKRRSRRQPDPGHSYRTVSAHSIFPYGDLRSHRRRICFPKTHHRPDSTVRTGNGYPSVRIDVCVIPR